MSADIASLTRLDVARTTRATRQVDNRRERVLRALDDGPATTAQLSRSLGVARVTMQRDLRYLHGADLVVQVGRARRGSFVWRLRPEDHRGRGIGRPLGACDIGPRRPRLSPERLAGLELIVATTLVYREHLELPPTARVDAAAAYVHDLRVWWEATR